MTKELPWYYIYSSNALTRLHFGPFTRVFFCISFSFCLAQVFCVISTLVQQVHIGMHITYKYTQNSRNSDPFLLYLFTEYTSV